MFKYGVVSFILPYNASWNQALLWNWSFSRKVYFFKSTIFILTLCYFLSHYPHVSVTVCYLLSHNASGLARVTVATICNIHHLWYKYNFLGRQIREGCFVNIINVSCHFIYLFIFLIRHCLFMYVPVWMYCRNFHIIPPRTSNGLASGHQCCIYWKHI